MLNTTDKIIKHKVGLLNLAEELGNVSRACKVMGLSRDTFYRYKSAVEEGGVEALFEPTRRKPNIKNRIDEKTEAAVVQYAVDFPAHGQARTSNELRKLGVFVSPSGVRCIWLRHDLANFKDRLKALEAKMAKEGLVLTEAQDVALEKKKQDDTASGEIETAHPGYLGSQDTFYVGTLKGVGRVYINRPLSIPTAKWPSPSSIAPRLRSPLLMCSMTVSCLSLESHSLPMLRILTDRGTEYCGKAEQHDYQLYLALNDIEHTKTKARSPQTNGICERFHKTILQEFYQVTFRKKLYADIDALQADLDEWIEFYNNERTHQGKMCCGRTPIATLEDGKQIWKEKFVA